MDARQYLQLTPGSTRPALSAADAGGFDTELTVNRVGCRRVRRRGIRGAQAAVGQRHPLVHFGGFIAALLNLVLAQRGLQRVQCVRVFAPAHLEGTPGLRGPSPEARGGECLCVRFQFPAMGFGFVEVIAAQRDLDSGATSPARA
jgi:hypothetical protein